MSISLFEHDLTASDTVADMLTENWLNNQKKRYVSEKLEQDRIVLLNDLNIRWTNVTVS